MSNLSSIGIVLLVSSISLVGDMLLKSATKHTGIQHNLYLISGCIVYFLVAFGFYFMYKKLNFAASGVMYALITMLLYVAIGFFVFKEKIELTEVIGLVFAFVGVILLSKFA